MRFLNNKNSLNLKKLNYVQIRKITIKIQNNIKKKIIKIVSKKNSMKRFRNIMNIVTKNIIMIYVKSTKKMMLIIILIENKETLKRKKE